MTITMATLRKLVPAMVAGAALITTGCSDTATQEDVADARQDVREEQADVREAQQDAQENISEAQQDAQEHTVGKPITGDDAAEARSDVAEGRQDAAENIAEEQQDVAAAKADLKTEEQRLAATQARDAYVKDVEGKLTAMKTNIDNMKNQASNAEGADKDALNTKIDAMQAQYDRTEDALDDLKGADLASWENHKEHVRTAMQADASNVR
jgi:DNA repair exonuclease SbcCD ATPase subunit